MPDYFIYTFIFEKEEYIQLEGLEKYFLLLMYSNTDNENRLIKSQESISELANTSKYVLSRKKRTFKDLELIDEINRNNIIMTIPSSVHKVEKIEVNSELIDGRYRKLKSGSKLFYIYCMYLQKQSGQEFNIYSNEEIKKPFTGSINTIKKYCNELEKVGLLEKVRTGISNSYHFKEIV